METTRATIMHISPVPILINACLSFSPVSGMDYCQIIRHINSLKIMYSFSGIDNYRTFLFPKRYCRFIYLTINCGIFILEI